MGTVSVRPKSSSSRKAKTIIEQALGMQEDFSKLSIARLLPNVPRDVGAGSCCVGCGLCFQKSLREPLLRRHDEVSYDVSLKATQEQSFVLNLLQQGRAEQDGERFKKYI